MIWMIDKNVWFIQSRTDYYIKVSYSTGRGKTGKTDAPIENELDIVRNWNFIRLVILAYFFARESFKLICIFYDFEAPPFENR